jgi:hypothetical protein
MIFWGILEVPYSIPLNVHILQMKASTFYFKMIIYNYASDFDFTNRLKYWMLLFLASI